MSNLLKTELYKLFHSWYFWGIGIFNLLLSSILLLDSKERSSNLIMASLYNIPLSEWWRFLPSLCCFDGAFCHHFCILTALFASTLFRL